MMNVMLQPLKHAEQLRYLVLFIEKATGRKIEIEEESLRMRLERSRRKRRELWEKDITQVLTAVLPVRTL